MAVSKRNWKRKRPETLQDAFNLCCEYALEVKRRPAKQMWDLIAATQQPYSLRASKGAPRFKLDHWQHSATSTQEHNDA